MGWIYRLVFLLPIDWIIKKYTKKILNREKIIQNLEQYIQLDGLFFSIWKNSYLSCYLWVVCCKLPWLLADFWSSESYVRYLKVSKIEPIISINSMILRLSKATTERYSKKQLFHDSFQNVLRKSELWSLFLVQRFVNPSSRTRNRSNAMLSSKIPKFFGTRVFKFILMAASNRKKEKSSSIVSRNVHS